MSQKKKDLGNLTSFSKNLIDDRRLSSNENSEKKTNCESNIDRNSRSIELNVRPNNSSPSIGALVSSENKVKKSGVRVEGSEMNILAS